MTSQPYLPAGPVGSVPPALLRRRTSALTWVTMVVLGVGALLIALLLLVSGGPVAAVVTTLLAAVSFPLLIAICFWLDRYEPEPARYRLAALGWGAVVAVILSFIAEQLLFSLPGTSTFLDTAVIAPLVEEFGKGLFLGAVVLLRRSQMHGLLDGIVYAALVGIGFAFVEDILYYLSSLAQGGGAALTFTFILRGVMGPFAHPLFTSVLGVGVGIGVSTRSAIWRWLAPLLGYLGAVLLHGVWNGSTFWGSQGFLVAYAAVMLPLLTLVLTLAIWARVREGRMLTDALQQTTALGWTRPEEIRWVARLQDRMSSRGYAQRIGGPQAKRALRAFQQTLTEIAFLHLRALDGTAPRDLHQRMLVLLQHAAALRPYVILPPPARPPAGLSGASFGSGPVGPGPASGGGPSLPRSQPALPRHRPRPPTVRPRPGAGPAPAEDPRPPPHLARPGTLTNLRRPPSPTSTGPPHQPGETLKGGALDAARLTTLQRFFASDEACDPHSTRPARTRTCAAASMRMHVGAAAGRSPERPRSTP